jgi:septal ring factor EnvC (AmiA/AmiB activator)
MEKHTLMRAAVPARPGRVPALFLLLLAASLLFSARPSAGADPAPDDAKKKNLEEISRQLEEKKKELDVYRAEEERITSELAGMKKEEKQSLSRRQDLEWQLDKSRSRSGEALQKYDSLEKARKSLAGDISGELVMYSLQKDFFYPYYGLRDMSKDMLIRSAIFSRSALLSSMNGESVRVNRDITALKLKSVDLKARQELLLKQSSAHKNVLKSKREELERTRAQQARLSAELENLQNSALGLTRLVKKLQKQAAYRSDADPGGLPLEKRSLPWPAEGKILSRFGREEVPALKTWIVREGVRIATQTEAPVRAVLAGKVIYSGPFRTYGNVVIVDHEKGFFTIYGLLSRIDAVKGQAVQPLSVLGLAGEDTQAVGADKKAAGSAVYFEIRKGDRALDPMQWLAN